MRNNLVEKVVTKAIQIQQIPAPTFKERHRAEFIHRSFLDESLVDVSIDRLGNVFGRIPGRGEKAPVVISAHSDTVFPEETDLTIKREADAILGAGIGDNSLGIAGLFGLIWMLRDNKVTLPGDLWLVANVGEEGLGNLCGMRAVVDRFEDTSLAYVVLEGMALGQIYYHALEVRRYRITVRTPGGHSWVDAGKPSAIHILAQFITRLVALPLPEQPRTSLNVGVISGGTTVNTIAAEAHMELDLRSEIQKVILPIVSEIEQLASEYSRENVSVTMDLIGHRPSGSIEIRHPLVQVAARALEAVGIQARFNTGSTDANVPLNRGYPAICLGLTNGCGAHTVHEKIYTAPLKQGLEQLQLVVQGVFRDM
jgi:tripeptide aminopeptidase